MSRSSNMVSSNLVVSICVFHSKIVEETRLLNQSPSNHSCDQMRCPGARCECEIVCDANDFCCYKCGCVCGFPKG
ncbi:hypothetical protein Anas_12926 [Armadillidium nasatum]|uniref:Uncharacterized protein n=1 Tax=Armadillidium nasatum TaxID=96803 RepID=A0A5N5T291_9CRUS|nr:hypothetical protein Anas_12926 [Armadillidium nasatum]